MDYDFKVSSVANTVNKLTNLYSKQVKSSLDILLKLHEKYGEQGVLNLNSIPRRHYNRAIKQLNDGIDKLYARVKVETLEGLNMMQVETLKKMKTATESKFQLSLPDVEINKGKLVATSNAGSGGVASSQTIAKNQLLAKQGLNRLIHKLLTKKSGGVDGAFWVDVKRGVVEYQQKLTRESTRLVNVEGNRAMNEARQDYIKVLLNGSKYKNLTVNTPFGEVKFSDGVEKYWIHGVVRIPAKPRLEHLQADGMAADENGLFRIAGELVERPGDFSDPSQNYNCTCAIGLRIKEQSIKRDLTK